MIKLISLRNRSTIFDQKLDSTLFLVNLIMIAEKRSTREQRSIYRGLRSVVRNMKWDLGELNSIYAYLSSHSHSSPVSFLRLGEHGVDFKLPTDQQFGLSAQSLEWAGHCLSHATSEMKRLFAALPERASVAEPNPGPPGIRLQSPEAAGDHLCIASVDRLTLSSAK